MLPMQNPSNVIELIGLESSHLFRGNWVDDFCFMCSFLDIFTAQLTHCVLMCANHYGLGFTFDQMINCGYIARKTMRSVAHSVHV